MYNFAFTCYYTGAFSVLFCIMFTRCAWMIKLIDHYWLQTGLRKGTCNGTGRAGLGGAGTGRTASDSSLVDENASHKASRNNMADLADDNFEIM